MTTASVRMALGCRARATEGAAGEVVGATTGSELVVRSGNVFINQINYF